MDNFNGTNVGNPARNDPIPFNDGTGTKSVSHAPLDLGGTSPAQPQQAAAPKPVVKPPSSPVVPAAAAKTAPKPLAAHRIEGVKTFFTKLHPGAIEFLDEQITRWLIDNPQVDVKHTNIAVGEVQAKKTEPNILITVWY
ncbi:MAG: hypothetical protein AAB403_18725 [Planctomycetota bacterium]